MAKLTGTNPDQVPTNADLGTMAYQDKDNVNVGSFTSNGIDDNATSTAMTLDSSGNLLVGKTSTGSNTVGSEIRDGTSGYTATFTGNDAANSVLSVMRNNGDGELIRLRNSSGNPVGTISTYSDGIVVGNSRSSSYANLRYTNDQVFPCTSTGGTNDNAIDLGKSTSRFQDLYLSGGVYLGGTGSANKLDDYEEGYHTTTFTPQTSGTITLSGTHRYLTYTKIGNRVYISGKVDISSVSSPVGDYVSISLPFAIDNTSPAGSNDSRRVNGAVWVGNSSLQMNEYMLYGIEGESAIRLYNASGTINNQATADKFSGNELVAITFHYRTA